MFHGVERNCPSPSAKFACQSRRPPSGAGADGLAGAFGTAPGAAGVAVPGVVTPGSGPGLPPRKPTTSRTTSMAEPASATWMVPAGLIGTTAKPDRTAPPGTTTAEVVGGGPAPHTPTAPAEAGVMPVTLSRTEDTPLVGTPPRPATEMVRTSPGPSGPAAAGAAPPGSATRGSSTRAGAMARPTVGGMTAMRSTSTSAVPALLATRNAPSGPTGTTAVLGRVWFGARVSAPISGGAASEAKAESCVEALASVPTSETITEEPGGAGAKPRPSTGTSREPPPTSGVPSA